MIIGWIALAVSLCILLGVAMLVDDWRRDFTQNHAKLDSTNVDPTLHPLLLPASGTEVADHIRSWTDSDARWQVVKVDQQGDRFDIHLTRSTRLRFVDDIQVKITTTDTGSRVDAESQSRVGIGDLGQNPRNLKQLTSSLRELGSVQPGGR